MIWRQWRGFVSKLLQFKAFLSIFLKPIFGSFVGDFFCRFHRFFSPQTRNLGGIPAITFTDWGGKTHNVCIWKGLICLKKWEQGRTGRKGRTGRTGRKGRKEIRMKDERVVCSLKLCSFLARGQSNWTRDESHACCRPQRMCNAQSLSCLLLQAHVLSSTGVTRFNAFLQNLGYHEPFALSFYFLLVRRRSRTQACHKWLRCGTFSMCGGLRANWYIIKMYNIWIYSNMRKG